MELLLNVIYPKLELVYEVSILLLRFPNRLAFKSLIFVDFNLFPIISSGILVYKYGTLSEL